MRPPVYRLASLMLLCSLGAASRCEASTRLEDMVSSLISLAAGQRPNDENGTASEFRRQALHDHSNDEIYDSTSQQIIERSGFKQRTFRVMSADGYLTELINLINPLADRQSLKRPPVMIFHGGVSDTSLWLCVNSIQHHPEKYPRNAHDDGPITSSNRSLAFMLANHGFDVWLVGTRGSNQANLGHARYKAKFIEDLLADLAADLAQPGRQQRARIGRELIDTIKYFSYTQDELAEFEFPRQIDAVLKLTGSQKVSIVALSFSTQIMFRLLASGDRVHSSRVHSLVALDPLLDLVGSSKIMEAIAYLAPIIPEPIGTILLQALFSRTSRGFLRKLDRYGAYKLMTTLFMGASPKYLTQLEDSLVGHVLLSTGFKEVQHYGQQLQRSRLQKFDYGPAGNQLVYGQSEPPVYDLTQIKLKRWMIVTGANDIMGTPSSGKKYVEQIRWKPYKHLNIEGYNHLDMVAAFNVDKKVNAEVLEFFDEFQSGE